MSEHLSDLLFPGSEFRVRLTIAFFHFLWQGAVIAIAAVAAGQVLRNAPVSFRYVLFSAALVCLPICVAITTTVVHLPETGERGVASTNSTTATQPIASPEPAAIITPSERLNGPSEPVAEEAGFSGAKNLRGGAANGPTEIPLLPADEVPTSNSPMFERLARASSAVSTIYLVGVIAFLLRFALAHRGARRTSLRSTRITDTQWKDIIRAQSKRLGLRVAPVVALCERVTVPTVLGIIRPMILLPASIMSGLTSEEFSAVLSHELAHIRRHDPWINLVQRLVECLLFFHPAVWFLSRRVSAEQAEVERERVRAELGLPVCDVFRHGADELVDAVLEFKDSNEWKVIGS